MKEKEIGIKETKINIKAEDERSGRAGGVLGRPGLPWEPDLDL